MKKKQKMSWKQSTQLSKISKFEPKTFYYKGQTKVVTSKEAYDSEMARGKWKPVEE